MANGNNLSKWLMGILATVITAALIGYGATVIAQLTSITEKISAQDTEIARGEAMRSENTRRIDRMELQMQRIEGKLDVVVDRLPPKK